jgi:hypothetical protein
MVVALAGAGAFCAVVAAFAGARAFLAGAAGFLAGGISISFGEFPGRKPVGLVRFEQRRRYVISAIRCHFFSSPSAPSDHLKVLERLATRLSSYETIASHSKRSIPEPMQSQRFQPQHTGPACKLDGYGKCGKAFDAA